MQKSTKFKKILTSFCIGILALLSIGGLQSYAYNDDGTTIPAGDNNTGYVAPAVTPVYVQPVTEPPTTKNPVIQEVQEAIDKLPKIEELKIENKQTLDDIQTKYATLSDTEKLEVTNYKTFTDLQAKMAILEKEALKVFTYSFSIDEKNPKLTLLIAYDNERPSFTFVSPSKEEIIVDSLTGNSKSLTFSIRDINPEDTTKPQAETESVTETQEETTTESKETPPKTGDVKEDTTETTTEPEGETTTQTPTVALKSHAMQIDIISAEAGVWTLKSSGELNFSTTPYTDPEKPTEPTTEEITTEKPTEKETKVPKKNAFGFLSKLFNGKSMTDIIIIIFAAIAILITLIIMGLKLKKGLKKGSSSPSDANKGQTPKSQNKEKGNKTSKPFFVSGKKNEEDKKEANSKKPKKEKDSLFRKKEQDLPVIIEEDDIEEEEKAKEVGKNVSLDETIYEADITSEDDDDIARLKASVEEMYAKVEQNFAEDKKQQQQKQKPSYRDEMDIDVQYVTQEDIDNDVTIEEYVDGDIISGTKETELEEKVKKRRSFFPDSDRFN